MQQNKKNSSNNKLFGFIMIITPLIIIVLFELLLRVVGYGDNFSLFVKHPDKEYSKYMVVNPHVGKKYFHQFEYTHPPKDIFLKNKPDSVFRIFVMGSSTVVGFPYENNLMFSRILHDRLEQAYPNKKIEVVNTAITAINSFTLRDYMPQVLKQKPDAILFYAGHNEFYGAFGAGSNEAMSNNRILINMHIEMMDLRVYQLIRNIMAKVAQTVNNDNTKVKRRGTLMARIVKDAEILYGSETYKRGIENYNSNMRSIAKMVKKANIPFFYSNLVSNVKDMHPFKSIESDQMESAGYYYNKALTLFNNAQYDEAYSNFMLARDYDGIRFRASSDINNLIRKICDEYDFNFVNTLAYFESNSPNNLIGYNLLTEHVHPNIQGQFLMAESFFNALSGEKLIDNDINWYTHKPFKYFVQHYGFTQLDYMIGKHRIENLKYHWPFRDESIEYIDYRQIYKPVSMIDSLAFYAMAKSDENLSNAHLQLAELYEKKGDYWNAFKEYQALTRTNIYWSPFFRDAADCLLKLNDLPGALYYFEQSNIYEPSFYAHFRAGEICLIKNDLPAAIDHFNKALGLAQNDEQLSVLNKKWIAHTYAGQRNEAENIKNQIKTIDQSFKFELPPYVYTFNSYIPEMVKPIVENAIKMINEGDFDNAINVLLESLRVYDSAVANRKLGELFYQKKQMDKSYFHLSKVYNDFKGDALFLHYMVIASLSNKMPDKASMALQQMKTAHPRYPELPKLEQYINNYNKQK